jgi:hypothetical protein
MSDKIYQKLSKVPNIQRNDCTSTDINTNIKILKNVYRLIICVLLTSAFLNSAIGEPLEKTDGSPSIFDLPDQGIFYGFVVNNSSHFVEIQLISIKNKRQIFSNIALPASISLNKKNMQALDDKIKCKYLPTHVIPLWLKLDCYMVSIRYRDDLIDDVQPGQWKSTFVVLDKEYREESPGPFTLEIEDDRYE